MLRHHQSRPRNDFPLANGKARGRQPSRHLWRLWRRGTRAADQQKRERSSSPPSPCPCPACAPEDPASLRVPDCVPPVTHTTRHCHWSSVHLLPDKQQQRDPTGNAVERAARSSVSEPTRMSRLSLSLRFTGRKSNAWVENRDAAGGPVSTCPHVLSKHLRLHITVALPHADPSSMPRSTYLRLAVPPPRRPLLASPEVMTAPRPGIANRLGELCVALTRIHVH